MQAKLQFSSKSLIAEKAGLSLTFSETPKIGFPMSQSIIKHTVHITVSRFCTLLKTEQMDLKPADQYSH